jgi:hypothetical protein
MYLRKGVPDLERSDLSVEEDLEPVSSKKKFGSSAEEFIFNLKFENYKNTVTINRAVVA